MENKILEKYFKTDKEFLKTLLLSIDKADIGITISNPSLADNPLVYTNKGFTKITGYITNEVIGKNCRFLQKDDRDQEGVKKIRQAISEGKSTRVRLRNYKKDGTMFWNELILSPIKDKSGNASYFIGIQTDVTKQVEIEEELANKMGELEKMNEIMVDRELRIKELKEKLNSK